MKRWQVLLLLLLSPFVCGATGTSAAVIACMGRYFESEPTGRLDLADFSRDLGCQWGRPEDRDALQRSGACGLPKQANDLIVLTHNWQCGWFACPVGQGAESNIALLRVGHRVALCDGKGQFWQGRVIWSREVIGGDPQPQAEFNCPTGKCGTIVTSVGPRWQGTYHLVRIAYKQVR